jgi:DNA-binding response OmpR family regulator
MTKTILLADDDGSVQTMIRRVLESEHYRVLLASTGREAASQFLNGPPDLVLLDLNMPDKDGWEAWHIMDTLHPFVPVIVITARPNQYEQAKKMRIEALMEKPLDLPLLLRTIKDLLVEPDEERIRRITDRNFKTALLTPTNHSGDNTNHECYECPESPGTLP